MAEVQANKIGETTLSKRLRATIKPNSHEIATMEAILIDHKSWLKGSVRGYPEHRRALIASAKANAAGESDRALCRKKGWDRRKFGRLRDFAAKLIADELNGRTKLRN